ncbi:TPA: hypothetical protein ACH3X1_006526 [Trebouxia sp. C0004]
MAEWHTILDQLEIPDGAVAGLSASDTPVLRGKLLQLPAADRPLFFVGQPLDVLKTLCTLLPDGPSGVAATSDVLEPPRKFAETAAKESTSGSKAANIVSVVEAKSTLIEANNHVDVAFQLGQRVKQLQRSQRKRSSWVLAAVGSTSVEIWHIKQVVRADALDCWASVQTLHPLAFKPLCVFTTRAPGAISSKLRYQLKGCRCLPWQHRGDACGLEDKCTHERGDQTSLVGEGAGWQGYQFA